MKSPLYVFGLLMRPRLLSEGYSTIVVECSAILSDDITLNPTMNFLNQKAFLAALKAMMYSAFMVEYVMIGCLKSFQLTTPPLHKKIHHDVDFLSLILVKE